MKCNGINPTWPLFWIFYIWTTRIGNAQNVPTCSYNNTVLWVKSGTECKLPVGSYDFTLVQVDGILHLPGNVNLGRFSKISAENIFVSRNAQIKADGYGYPGGHGVGKGNPDGSGGKQNISTSF